MSPDRSPPGPRGYRPLGGIAHTGSSGPSAILPGVPASALFLTTPTSHTKVLTVLGLRMPHPEKEWLRRKSWFKEHTGRPTRLRPREVTDGRWSPHAARCARPAVIPNQASPFPRLPGA